MPKYKMKVTRQVTETTEVTVEAKNAEEARNMAENGIVFSETQISGPDETRTVDEASISRLQAPGEGLNPTEIYEQAEAEIRRQSAGFGRLLKERHEQRLDRAARGLVYSLGRGRYVDQETEFGLTVKLEGYAGSEPEYAQGLKIQVDVSAVYSLNEESVHFFTDRHQQGFLSDTSKHLAHGQEAETMPDFVMNGIDFRLWDLAIFAYQNNCRLQVGVKPMTDSRDVLLETGSIPWEMRVVPLSERQAALDVYQGTMSDLHDELVKKGEELAEVFAERKEAAAVDYEWDAPCVMARLNVAVAYDDQTPLSGKPASAAANFSVIYDTDADRVLLFRNEGEDMYFLGKEPIGSFAEALAADINQYLDLKAMDLACNAPENPLKLIRKVEMPAPIHDVRADIEYDVQGIWTGVENLKILGEYGPKSSGMKL